MIYYSEYLIVVGVFLGLYGVGRKRPQGKKRRLINGGVVITLAKVEPEVYKGISYVRLSNLPKDQKQIMSQSAIPKIKIKTESSVLTDCVQYLDYEKWYESNK